MTAEPAGGHWMVCPSCESSYGGLVQTSCPLCGGWGLLALGPIADAGVPPRAVARAVQMATSGLGFRTPHLPPIDHERRVRLGALAVELVARGVLRELPPVPMRVPEVDDPWPDERRRLGREAGAISRLLGSPGSREPETGNRKPDLDADPGELPEGVASFERARRRRSLGG